jgi:hypothetical protein
MIDLSFPDMYIALNCKNQSTIDLADYYRVSEVSKQIDIYHHMRELVYNRTLPLIYIPIINKLTDIYTKGLSEV